MNYYFNLYKKGPYSPQLTDDYYKNPSALMTFKTNNHLTDIEIKKLNRIKKVVFKHPVYFKSKTDLLQALSTLLYFKDNDSKLLNDDLLRLTKNAKPYLSERIIIIALNLVEELKQ